METSSSIADKNGALSERDIEDISSRIENRMSKHSRDCEYSQRETRSPIDNLSSKVDNVSSVSPEQSCSTAKIEQNGGLQHFNYRLSMTKLIYKL